jgi:hypothetical protein
VIRWTIERVVHFKPGDLVHDGFVHFGFHDRVGRQYAVEHQRHFVGLVGDGDRLEWTVASSNVFPKVQNIVADLESPMYVDGFPDETLVVSNLGNALLYRIDTRRMTADLLVDGRTLGMVDMGNCVVDEDGFVWVNEVTGCRIWRFDPAGRPVETLGDGNRGFQPEVASFEKVRFGWVYDIRRGPGREIYVLDSTNFAVRVIDIDARSVATIAGARGSGYGGDGGDARAATFGSDPSETYDGPISLSVDEVGNVYVGDRLNHVVRAIDRASGVIDTIAGRPDARPDRVNDPVERDPMRANLPQISSMDYDRGRLFVPTDLAGGAGDLLLLRSPEEGG